VYILQHVHTAACTYSTNVSYNFFAAIVLQSIVTTFALVSDARG
jgi:hypothetical protein